jgi:hypothetical protein
MFEFDEHTSDTDRLQGFVLATEQLVSMALSNGYWALADSPIPTNVVLAPEAREAASSALQEFNEQKHVHELIVAIGQASNDTLESHGLTGEQLRFKLTNVQLREQRFRSRPFFRPLQRLIKAIDTLLDSILDSVPGGSALKELKDAALDATEGDDS